MDNVLEETVSLIEPLQKFILVLEATKIPDAKAAVDKEWEKT